MNGRPRATERSLRPERARANVQDAPEQEVSDEPVDPAGEEDDDRDDDGVTGGVVHQVVHRWRREHRGHSRQPDERQHRLLPRVHIGLRVVAEGREDTARTLKHDERTEQPGLLP